VKRRRKKEIQSIGDVVVNNGEKKERLSRNDGERVSEFELVVFSLP
jgi:hypothetical protein